MRFLLLCAGQNQDETHLENVKVPGAVSMLSDEFCRLDLDSKRTSSDTHFMKFNPKEEMPFGLILK